MTLPQTGGGESGQLRALAPLGLLAIAIMAPVTLPVPVLRELVQDRFQTSEFVTSLFMSINMIGALLMAPVAGAIADRWGRPRRLLVIALLIDALCFFFMTAPFPLAIFMGVRLIEGCAHITALSVLLTLASSALPAPMRGRAMGVTGGCMMLGVAIGAPLGGVLGRGGPLLPLQVGGVLVVVAALLGARLLSEHVEGERRPGFREIVSALRSHPELMIPLAFAFTDRFTVGFFTTTFSLYLRRIYEVAPDRIGITIAIFMLPFALFSYPFGRIAERRSIILLLCVGSGLYGIGTAAVGFAGPGQIEPLMFAIGICAAVMFVPSMVMTIQLAPDSIRATAMGAFNAAGSLGFIAGPLVGGGVSQLVAAQTDWATGYRMAFLTAGASEMLCVAIALPFLIRLRAEGRAS